MAISRWNPIPLSHLNTTYLCPPVSTPFANFLNMTCLCTLLLLESGWKQGPHTPFICYLPLVSFNAERADSLSFFFFHAVGLLKLLSPMICRMSAFWTCLSASSWCHCLFSPHILYDLEVSSKGLPGFRFNFLWQGYFIGDIRTSLKWEPCISYYITAALLFLILPSKSGCRDCQPSYPNTPPIL